MTDDMEKLADLREQFTACEVIARGADFPGHHRGKAA
jgi:hypothetical protein